jgi:hypothetical protein
MVVEGTERHWSLIAHERRSAWAGVPMCSPLCTPEQSKRSDRSLTIPGRQASRHVNVAARRRMALTTIGVTWNLRPQISSKGTAWARWSLCNHLSIL